MPLTVRVDREGRIAISLAGVVDPLVFEADTREVVYFKQRGSQTQSRLAFLSSPFKICTMAIMVFQFRVVARIPNSLSICPR